MTTKDNNLRLFYALWPDDATRSALVKLQLPTQRRRISPEDLHLTLVFLGAQPSASLPVLQALMAKLPAAAITLNVDCLGHFSKNGITWAGMKQTPDRLTALRHALLAALTEQNIAFDQETRFVPHITLARDATTATPAMTPIIWQADHITLVQSTTSTAPRYRLLASRRLEGTT